jgi:predicted Zn-dependent protease
MAEAVARHPNSGWLRAQLAWALFQAGDPSAAAREAQTALRLDQQTPHMEQKLANLPSPPGPEGESAEQLMLRLRKAPDDAAPDIQVQ